MTSLILYALLVHGPAGSPPDLRVPTFEGADVPAFLSYRVVADPEAPPNTPIVIAVHGLGDNANGFVFLVKRLRLPFRFVIPNGPFRTRGKGRSWYRRHSQLAEGDVDASSLRVRELVDQVRSRWPDAGKPYLMGFSQGGVMTYAMAARHPDLFSGLVSIAGYLIPDDQQFPRARPGYPPVLIVHGKHDAVVRHQLGEEAMSRLKSQGWKVDIFTHSGQHRVPPPATDAIRDWLLKTVERRTGRGWVSPAP